MNRPKILAFAGSTRIGSLNKKLLNNAERSCQLEVTKIDLKDYPLPLYDGDLEAKKMPENALKLKELFMSHDGLILASPEYNSSISGVLKNAIDWVSRPIPSESEYLIGFKNKVCALMSASPGQLGGLRGLIHVRSILTNVGALVIPGQVCIANADQKFDERGELTDEKFAKQLAAFMKTFCDILTKLN